MKRGAAWEFQLEIWHDFYRSKGLAVVRKTNPPITMHTDKDKRGRFTASYRGVSTVDFVGFLSPFGIGVSFDAKEVTNGTVLPLSRIEPHQQRDLEADYLAGAHSFIAARFVKAQKMVVFPWEYLRSKYGDGSESVNAKDGLEFGAGGWLELPIFGHRDAASLGPVAVPVLGQAPEGPGKGKGKYRKELGKVRT